MTYAGKTSGKNKGSPSFFFPRQFFSRAPVCERLEQAMFDFKCARSPTLSHSCILKPNVASAITNNDVTIVHRLHVHAK